MALQNPIFPSPQKGSSTNSPAPQTASPALTWTGLRRSLDSSVSDNTRAMYNSAWRGFEA